MATLAAGVLAMSALAAGAGQTKWFLLKSIAVGSDTHKYVVYVPEAYNGRTKWPTIIFLNGYGECGKDGLKQISVGLGPAIMSNSQEWPFIVIFPQKPEFNENWERYDDMVMAILQQTRKEYSVDPSRVYLTGLSQGGHGTWAIGAKHPDLFAAIAPVCGWGDETTAQALRSVPVWAFHGEADPVVNIEGSRKMVDAVNAAGGNAKLTSYPGVEHNSWDKAYREEKLGSWFLQHVKGAQGSKG